MSISKVFYDKNGKEHRAGNYTHVKNLRKNKKITLVKLAGGKCCICQYNKCLRSLSFHHINPKIKSFSISTGGMGRSLNTLIQECQKCILVCANCHAEIHDNLINASDYYIKR